MKLQPLRLLVLLLQFIVDPLDLSIQVPQLLVLFLQILVCFPMLVFTKLELPAQLLDFVLQCINITLILLFIVPRTI